MNQGVWVGISAYVVWGLAPLYWRMLDDVAAGDVVLFRVVATALFLGAIQTAGRTWARVRRLVADPRARWRFAATAVLLASNWLAFVWAVNDDRVLEASLGYFINPLLSVVLGVVVLRERLRPIPLLCVGVAAVGVVVLTVDVGTAPWVSLYLAASFALYGLLRKTSPAGSLDGLTIEASVLAPIAVSVLGIRALAGDGVLGISVPGRDLLLLGAGLVTASPLLLFASAARRIHLWLIGMLQFIAPTLQFLLGVLLWDEEWSGGQVTGYVIIWAALVIFAVERMAASRRGAPVLSG